MQSAKRNLVAAFEYYRTLALQNLIQKENIKEIKNYFGKIDLGIDLDIVRNR